MKKRIYTEKYIDKLIAEGIICNNLTALYHSVLKHLEIEERNRHSYDRMNYSKDDTCPMCKWIAIKKVRGIKKGEIYGKRCVLAGSKGGVCNNGINCCNWLWGEYFRSCGYIKPSHLKMTEFIEKRYEQLKRKRDKNKGRKR